MSRRVLSLKGRIEYDPFTLYAGHGDRNPYTGTVTPYCTVRLHLFDLPAGATVRLVTVFELHARRFETCRAYLVPRWRSDYCATFRLEASGRLRIEVYTKKHTHRAEYRIDPEQQRPIRGQFPGQRSKLELDVDEKLFLGDDDQDERPDYRQPPPALAYPVGSLWARL